MKNWGSLAVTNVLLLIIAILMFVQISSNSSSRSPGKHDLSSMGSAPRASSQMVNPHEHMEDETSTQAPKGDGFSFQNMVFAALRCPSDGTVTLADIGCKGKDADERRKFVSSLSSQNLPPRMMFDKIIEKFGEKALTDEALEIRTNNRR